MRYKLTFEVKNTSKNLFEVKHASRAYVRNPACSTSLRLNSKIHRKLIFEVKQALQSYV